MAIPKRKPPIQVPKVKLPTPKRITSMILAEGRTPYLHVSASNKSAWTLYENLGFVPTRELHSVKMRLG